MSHRLSEQSMSHGRGGYAGWRKPSRSNGLIVWALLFTCVALPTAYLKWPWLTLYRLAFLLAVPAVVFSMVLRRGRGQRGVGPIGPRTRTLFVSAVALVTYMLIIDLTRNDPQQGFNDFLMRLTVFGVIFLGALVRTSFWWRVRVLLLVSIIPMAFGAMQVFFPGVEIESLAPKGSVIGFHTTFGVVGNYVELTGRIRGTTGTNAIFFALYLGLVAIAGFSAWRRGAPKWTAAVALMAVALAPLTFTRSLLFGLVPSAALGIGMAMPKLKRKVATVAVGTLLVLATVFLLVPAISSVNDRVSTVDDTQTMVKLRSNLYGARYTLEHSPWIGIRYSELYQSLAASYDPSDFAGRITLERLSTNHNQFGFMIRYYGLIGLGLILWLVVATFRLIAGIEDRWARALLTGALIFILQFSVLHNVYMYGIPMFWLLVAGVEREAVQGPLMVRRSTAAAKGPRR